MVYKGTPKGLWGSIDTESAISIPSIKCLNLGENKAEHPQQASTWNQILYFLAILPISFKFSKAPITVVPEVAEIQKGFFPASIDSIIYFSKSSVSMVPFTKALIFLHPEVIPTPAIIAPLATE